MQEVSQKVTISPEVSQKVTISPEVEAMATQVAPNSDSAAFLALYAMYESGISSTTAAKMIREMSKSLDEQQETI